MTRNKSKQSARETAPAGKATPADAVPVSEAPPPSRSAAEEMETVRKELEASRDRHVRLLADFENFRRRVARDRDEMTRRAHEGLLTELLPVLDHFELALSQAPDPDSPFVTGVRMVYEQLMGILAKAGLNVIDASGTAFDHNIHEAVAVQTSAQVPEGNVIQQTRRGYSLGDHVLRPANVIVSSGAPQPATAADEKTPADNAEDPAAEK
jgi:molecular chaperone GrpE